MPSDYTFPSDLTRRWLALAQRRKAHLLDLYESGRWQRYYSETEFTLRLREAINAVEQWSATAHPPDTRGTDGDARKAETWAPPTQPADESAAAAGAGEDLIPLQT